ncbi:response regulator [Curtobacterium sp. MCBA15_013]|jgi:DNA-binding NarL/FixJ family response regulator|uniref:response regulator n=1 Tax=Curtobacterium sp. MCBA15_013 TaxID=1898739 RepID=UPI0008DC7780|nr:response regulator transcription factor [Curtobacterium sp. MCBA15_013]OII19242.1 DNA-binding response regulator [Curtobacterium sp. MCBA15_013]
MTTRVFLVDDHEIVRRGVADLIDAEPDLEVVGEAGTVRDTVGRVAATLPDVVVLDVRLPDGSGIDACRSVRSAFPDIACLMLTAYDDDRAMQAAILAGAAGYVVKDIRGQTLLEDIRRVAAGRRLLPAATVPATVERLTKDVRDDVPELTMRERQVLELIAGGLTNRQIGDRLGLAEKTVKNYVSGLLAKLGLERRTQAAVYGADHGVRDRRG